MSSPQVSVSQLDRIMQGQAIRTRAARTRKMYLSLLKKMMGLLLKVPELKAEAFEFDTEGNFLYHSGDAHDIKLLKFPMSQTVARRLFALISIDPTLVRKKRNRQHLENQEGNQVTDLATDNPAKDVPTVTAQSYSNYRSALKWWHELEDETCGKQAFPWPTDVSQSLQATIHSYKRDIGDKKRRGIMDQSEGKSPYNLHGYKVICQHFCKMKPSGHKFTWNEGLFGALFTVMSVNTIGRSDNISDMLLSNMDWLNDAMVIRFGTTKADQSGEKTCELKRIYCNPFMPEVCAIFHLAVYTWCKRRTADNSENVDNRNLFDGKDQNKRYYQILTEVVQTQIPAEENLGCSRSDIGTHSNRKFAESTAASKVDGPSKTHVCLRAGQDVGRTQKSYMFAEDDGDALVGRTVAQLQLNADEFDILAPHFNPETLQELNTYGWSNILDGYQHYPPSFKRIIPFLFATLVYQWREGNLTRLFPDDHPIFKQKIFTNQTLISSIAPKVIFVYAYCQASGISATGVPSLVLISREVRAMKAEHIAECAKLGQKIDKVQDDMNKKLDSYQKLLWNHLENIFKLTA